MSSAAEISDAPTHHWDELARRLDDFLTAWEQAEQEKGSPPTIQSFLPAEPAALRRLVLVELIKSDMEQRVKMGAADSVNPLTESFKRLETYAAQFPELREASTGEPPVDLIYEEYHLRRAAGENVSVKEYIQRFPKSQEGLRKLLGAEGISVSSALFPARRVVQPKAGEKIDDFELLSELGKGAFASVFLARQVSMQRLVALKISAEKGSEPQTLAQLDHPHIVRVYDQRIIPEQKTRLLYMQYVPGGTLAEVVACIRRTPAALRTGGQLIATVDVAMSKSGQAVSEDAPWRRRISNVAWPQVVCRIGTQLASALDYAHKMGILHRDVKPANVLLTSDGMPKLADFNISYGSHVVGTTPAAYFGGSLAYMSPEQLEACNPLHKRKPADLDNRADLYSLAVVLWELLHGDRPFHDVGLEEGWNETVEEMIWQRREMQITESPLSTPAGEVLRRLEKVLRKALSPEPKDRYQSGAEMARELTLCLHRRSWELFHDFGFSWRGWARRRPLLALIPINIVPNALAAAYNWWFNYTTMIEPGDEAIRAAFWYLQFIVNGVAFPLGVALGCAYAWPAIWSVWKVARGRSATPDELADARCRSLRLGQVIALVGVSLWLVSGIVFPVAMHLLAGHLSAENYLQFFLSLATCGLIAAAFPYLGTTWLALRVYYPALLSSSSPTDREVRLLESVPNQAGFYLAIAAVVPMLAVLLVIVGGLASRFASGLLIVAGVVGFLAAWFTYNQIRSDIAALSVATRASDSFGVGTESDLGMSKFE
ncbi:MAG: serine/threonine protein kinase [Planctomycetales bacterium]|nr:serine/threonine protein kinase [Planctomycetales bacterium]